MAQVALSAPVRSRALGAAVFPVAIFASAALVFFVEPMVAKLVLPLLGGSPAVWNTSLAFFQAALLAGYVYAHLLQRVRSVRTQGMIHLGVLLAAGATLPLRLSTLLGDPPVGAPTLWLLGELALTIGAPFAVLSATAPLLQAWSAKRAAPVEAGKVFGLYAASNLGSLLALTAYPFLVEPQLTLAEQRLTWTLGYALFVGLVALVFPQLEDAAGAPAHRLIATRTATPAVAWRTRGAWVFLAAVPSSLVLGVTTHLTANVGSSPFLWVIPLGLYLLTFVIAFAARPTERVLGLSRPMLLGLHGAALIACVIVIGLSSTSWLLQLPVNLIAFFLAALVCHLALVDRRPGPEHLTEFYLLMSLGGVIGGSFNAFLAPALFPNTWEYPLVLVLAALARPWNLSLSRPRDWAIAAGGVLATVALAAMIVTGVMPTIVFLLALVAVLGAAIALRKRGLGFAAIAAAMALTAQLATAVQGSTIVKRSFFGVHHVATVTLPGLGPVRELIHGSILHGAQMLDPQRHCTTMTYYAAPTPIARAFALVHARTPAAQIGAVGLGTGAVAALTTAGDHLRFYEIDPAVVSLARSDGLFDYVTACAKGRIDYTLGDGRLSLAHATPGALDLLLVDAFSSDSVPTHLLTTEAFAVYLNALKPDGVLVLHLTNRNLSLVGPAAAAARALHAEARVDMFVAPAKAAPLVNSSAVMVVSRSPGALEAFARDPRWKPAPDTGQRPWTDDYVNVLGALLAHVQGRP